MRRRRRPFATPRSRKSNRPKADWVYRGNSIVLGTGLNNNDLLGTYEPLVTTLSTGPLGATSNILYDSVNYLAILNRAGVGASQTQATQGVTGRWSRAEGRKPLILAVQGHIVWTPQTWTIGSQIHVGVRLGCFEQDSRTGSFLVDPGYSMWTEEPAPVRTPVAAFANNRRLNVWETRQFKPFGDSSTTPSLITAINWRGRKYLESHECMGIWLELPANNLTSVGMRYQMWMRTLVSDEG